MDAADFFAARLRFQTDPADLAAARAQGRGPVVLDVRSADGWAQGRIPGARHAPLPELEGLAARLVPDRSDEVVVYCWGPGCNGSTRAGLLLARLGFDRVRELIGGVEYWTREGFALETDQGRVRRSPDPLTAPAGRASTTGGCDHHMTADPPVVARGGLSARKDPPRGHSTEKSPAPPRRHSW